MSWYRVSEDCRCWEERTRDDGMGSTTVAWRPCTRQERWVTAWTVTEFSANA